LRGKGQLVLYFSNSEKEQLPEKGTTHSPLQKDRLSLRKKRSAPSLIWRAGGKGGIIRWPSARKEEGPACLFFPRHAPPHRSSPQKKNSHRGGGGKPPSSFRSPGKERESSVLRSMGERNHCPNVTCPSKRGCRSTSSFREGGMVFFSREMLEEEPYHRNLKDRIQFGEKKSGTRPLYREGGGPAF